MKQSHHPYPSFLEAMYERPHKNVLALITCIGLRLTYNFLDLLEAKNLRNRHDQFSFAGALLYVGETGDYPC